jgi:hypothetical protein
MTDRGPTRYRRAGALARVIDAVGWGPTLSRLGLGAENDWFSTQLGRKHFCGGAVGDEKIHGAPSRGSVNAACSAGFGRRFLRACQQP